MRGLILPSLGCVIEVSVIEECHRFCPEQLLIGVVLQKIFQRSLLENVLWNLPNDRLVVLTSIESGDDVLAEFCESRNILVSRGSETNVFDRFYQGIQEYPAPFYIRVTGDNPLTDPEIIDYMVQNHLKKNLD